MYDFDKIEGLDNIEMTENQKKSKYFLAHAIFASMLMFWNVMRLLTLFKTAWNKWN